MMKATVYELRDPLTQRARYVGITWSQNWCSDCCMKMRLRHHLINAAYVGTPEKREWLTSLAEKGLAPTIHVLAIVPLEDGLRVENEWIDRLIEQGEDLVNGCRGRFQMRMTDLKRAESEERR